MIKSGEYIQLLEFFSKDYNFSLLYDYSRFEQIQIIETCKRFDEVRLIHKKYKSECESWRLYPNKHLNNGLEKLNLIRKDLQDVCRQFKIRIMFYEYGTVNFKKGFFASYFHEQRQITDLIVFNIERKESSTSHFEIENQETTQD